MARKRLGPARGIGTEPEDGMAEMPVLETKALFSLGRGGSAPPPIAQVSAQAAAHAAAEKLAEDIRDARDNGRLVVAVALEDIAEGWLIRDRLGADPEELETLKTSIRDRGQQTPIELVDLGPETTPRYGLVSGWRRLAALRALQAESDPLQQGRFATIAALLRRPETAAEAYRAMVEENEIRVGLSYYERARIVAEAADKGIFRDRTTALSILFAAASRARRSKIGSFVKLHDALGDRLRHPTAIPERLGLLLARALEDGSFGPRLADRLRKAAPDSAEAEAALLEKALAEATEKRPETGGSDPVPAPASRRDAPSPAMPLPGAGPQPDLQSDPRRRVYIRRLETGLFLTGGTGPEFETALQGWLQKWAQGKG